MAELAKTYHDNLQNQGQEGRDIELRNQTTESILEKVETEPNLSDQQRMSSPSAKSHFFFQLFVFLALQPTVLKSKV